MILEHYRLIDEAETSIYARMEKADGESVLRDIETRAILPRCLLMRQVPGSHKQRLRRLRRQIEQLPPYPALLILAGPLAVIEPLKLATIFIGGEGHWITSRLVMLFAYAISCHSMAHVCSK